MNRPHPVLVMVESITGIGSLLESRIQRTRDARLIRDFATYRELVDELLQIAATLYPRDAATAEAPSIAGKES